LPEFADQWLPAVGFVGVLPQGGDHQVEVGGKVRQGAGQRAGMSSRYVVERQQREKRSQVGILDLKKASEL
jgi:hypothetical protein